MEQNAEAQVPNKQEPVRSAAAATSSAMVVAGGAVVVADWFGVSISVGEAVSVVAAVGVVFNLLSNEIARQKVFAPFKRQ